MLRTIVTVASLVVFFSPPAFSQEPFTDEADARGVALVTIPVGLGHGMALNDLDGDDDLDLVLTGHLSGQVKFFENDGNGYFTDRTNASPGLPTSTLFSGVTAADYDADGDLDLFISGHSVLDLLLRNDGNFTFADVSTDAGISNDGPTMGCCWGDYDNDGYPDLYVVNRTLDSGSDLPNLMYRNNGNGTFSEVGFFLGVDDLSPSCQAVFYDHDRDGFVDLYLSNDKGYTMPDTANRLWRSNGDGSLEEISEGSGADVAIFSMGVALGDLDRNGAIDVYITNGPEGNPLLMNQGDGTYVDLAADAGVLANEGGWGTFFLDYDNDGYLDLFVCNVAAPNMLFRSEGGIVCEEIAADLEIDTGGATWCAAGGDIDGDGDIDLVVQNTNDPIRLFINHEGEQRNWLKVKPVDPGANGFALGAIIEVDANGITQAMSVNGGSSYKASLPKTLHFGLGDATTADAVRVYWPGGTTNVYFDVPANQMFVADKYPDCDLDGTSDADEIAAGAADVNGNGIPDECEASFRRGDCNGDSLTDLVDAICTLSFLFAGADVGCAKALDFDDDGNLGLPDPINLLIYLYQGGAAPPGPFLGCGVDFTDDDLGCTTQPGCP